MLLKNLIKLCPKEFASIKINNLCLDSRKLKRGDIFFALKGSNSDGRKYINDAIKNGAKIIVSNLKSNKSKKKKILFIHNKNPRKLLSVISSRFYKHKPNNIVFHT